MPINISKLLQRSKTRFHVTVPLTIIVPACEDFHVAVQHTRVVHAYHYTSVTLVIVMHYASALHLAAQTRRIPLFL